MRLPRPRHLALLPVAAMLCISFAAPALAAWSHHPVSSSSNSLPPVPAGTGTTTTTTTTTIPGGFVVTALDNLGKPVPIPYLSADPQPNFRIVRTTPNSASTTTTTVTKNADGTTTTTTSTTVAATGVTTVTVSLTNLPTVGQKTPTDKQGNYYQVYSVTVAGTTARISLLACNGGECGSIPTVFVTQTIASTSSTPVPPTTTSSDTTALPDPKVPPSHATIIAQAATIQSPAIVQAASERAQAAIEACGAQTPPCVADALDAYATELEKLADQLPPRMRALPAIIHTAARKVRVARTRAEAVRAVVATLQVASNKLEKATGL